MPIGVLLLDPAPIAKAMGTAPNIVARLVIRIGLSLAAAASLSAARLSRSALLWRSHTSRGAHLQPPAPQTR